MMDFERFVNAEKACLIAPAGYGKTFTIVECLKYAVGKQLILTHTHAGIASIKEKIPQSGVEQKLCTVETISSFAQTYVHWFYNGTDIPDQSKSSDYHSFILQKAESIFASRIVQKVIGSTFTGLFVDEYQDCTRQQHLIIKKIANILPTRILGDPLQGIFNFNGDLVNFEEDIEDFEKFPELDVPYRWYKDGNNNWLGDRMKEFRQMLSAGRTITLKADNAHGLNVFQVLEDDIYNPESKYATLLKKIIANRNNLQELESLLVLVPEFSTNNPAGGVIRKGDIHSRDKLKNRIDFSHSLTLLEAIDDSLFYSLAAKVDKIVSGIHRARKPVGQIRKGIWEHIFLKTSLNIWLNGDQFKAKRDDGDKGKALLLKDAFDNLMREPSIKHVHDLIVTLKKNLKVKIKRSEVFKSLLNAMRDAHNDGSTVEEAMRLNRNHLRRSGRKVIGKCIGTTLLTKGLEFDTVVILDAHRFDSPQHLYVALTRCCKRLVIFTENLDLKPYPG